MNELPSEILGLDETSNAEPVSGWFWLVAILSIPVFLGLGILVALTLPHHESDWFGARYLVTIGAGLLCGALACTGFTIASVCRGERHSLWAVLASIPCAVLLLYVAVQILGLPISRDLS